MELTELRHRMPKLRQRELALQAQSDALETELGDAERYLQLTESLETFLVRLETASQTLSIVDQQRVLRLVVKQVEISADTVIIKHSIPTSSRLPPTGYLLRGRSPKPRPGQRVLALRPRRMDGDGGEAADAG